MILAVINWQANPLALEFGSLRIAWYGVLFALAFLLGNKFMIHIFKQENITTKLADKLLTYVFFGTIIGARLGHCLFYDWNYFSQNPLEIIMIWRGGLASHGGMIGIIIATYIFSKKNTQINFWWLLDRLGLTLILCAPLIRLGNFMNSEIVGIPTQKPWGVNFLNHLNSRPDLLIDNQVVPRHPVQLYEALAYIIIFVICLLIYRKYKLPNGFLSSILFFSIFTARFFIEFLKVRQADYSQEFSLSVGQYLSLPPIIFGLAFALKLATQIKKS